MTPLEAYDAALGNLCMAGASQEDIDGCDELRADYIRMRDALQILQQDGELSQRRYFRAVIDGALERSSRPTPDTVRP